MAEYITVQKAAIAEITEKRSRFIAYVFPVKTEAEATAHIAEIRKKHHDARHNVYAYIINEGNIARYTDDGEPSGTAGVPVLDCIKKRGVTDCLVVVTRYFGGILLGTGGLVRAYSAAAVDGIAAAGAVKVLKAYSAAVTCDYADYERLQRLLSLNGCEEILAEFLQSVTVSFKIKTELFLPLCDKLREEFCGKLNVEKCGNCEVFEKI